MCLFQLTYKLGDSRQADEFTFVLFCTGHKKYLILFSRIIAPKAILQHHFLEDGGLYETKLF